MELEYRHVSETGSADHLFVGTFASCLRLRQNPITDFDFLNGTRSIFGVNQGASCKTADSRTVRGTHVLVFVLSVREAGTDILCGVTGERRCAVIAGIGLNQMFRREPLLLSNIFRAAFWRE